MHTRSIAGCYTCKARKKKCDEARPKCQRCIRGGFECGGYAPLNNPDGKGVMRRSKAPPSVSESSQLPTRSSEVTSFSHSSGLAHARQAGSQGSSLIEESVDSIATDRSGDPRYSPGIHSTGPPVPIRQDAQLHLASSPWAEPGVSAFSLVNSVVNGPPTILYPRFNKHIAPSPSCSSGGSSSTISSSSRSPSDISLHYSSNVPPTIPPVFTSSRQATPIQALFSPSESETDLPEYSLRDPNDQISRIAYGPIWPSPYPCVKAKVEQPNTDDEDDPEGVSRALCRAVTPDPNTRDNSLPFVLQSYARWVNFVVFDPLRVIHLMRENIIAQFSSCQESRTRVILMSNVLGSLSKSLELNPKSLSTVAMLRIEACRAMEQYRSTKFNGQRGVDVREALQVLGQMSEIIIVQRYTGRFSNVAQLMQDAAPVFRQACPEPPGQLVNLPKLLLHPDLNLRSFAATDVIISITKARPMLFKYDVTHTPEMAEQLANGELGLQWLHGVPDQVIVLLARINVLYEDFGTNIDPRCISDIEEQTRNIKVRPPSASADPFATIWRLMVHECWRQTVYIYLYMVLCGAQANDPRVLKAVRVFTRLVDGVRSGRNPDAFLFIPIMVAGASAYEGWDRDILLQRMLGLQECTTPNTAGYESLMILLDIWERTKAENRPAVWQDLIIASLKIAG